MKHLLYLLLVYIITTSLTSCGRKITEQDFVETPSFSPSGGMCEIGQQVVITCRTKYSEIRYTLDGSEPDSSSLLYITPLIIPTIFPPNSNTGTIKAKAFKAGFAPSLTKESTFSVTYANTVANPVISPQSDSILYGSHISISCSTSNNHIRYTLNGDEPTLSSTLYHEPINANINSGLLIVKAKAFRNSWNPSQTSIAHYIVSPSNGWIKLYNQTSYPVYIGALSSTYTIQAGFELILTIPISPELFNKTIYDDSCNVYIEGETFQIWDVDLNSFVNSTYIGINAGDTTDYYVNPNRACIKVINQSGEYIKTIIIQRCTQSSTVSSTYFLEPYLPPSGVWFKQQVPSNDTMQYYYLVQIILEDDTIFSYGNEQNILYVDDEFLVVVP